MSIAVRPVLVRVARGLYIAADDAADEGDATRRITILNARGHKVRFHQWDPMKCHRRMPAARAIAVDAAIGRLHKSARMIASANGCMCAADRCHGGIHAGLLATAALDMAEHPDVPVAAADAVRTQVLALCASWPNAPWALCLLARLSAATSRAYLDVSVLNSDEIIPPTAGPAGPAPRRTRSRRPTPPR